MDDGASPDAVVLFDGVCNLCNGFVRFAIPRDPHRHLRFAALDSPAAIRLMTAAGVAPGSIDSVVLIDGGRAFVRSAAVLRIARRLRFPWPLVYGLVVVPRPVRDWMYDVVARHRLGWFGRREACLVPGPETQDRFLVDTSAPVSYDKGLR
jgi:predicted DCC family thiol-disulfide oxidoreductase YuxK